MMLQITYFTQSISMKITLETGNNSKIIFEVVYKNEKQGDQIIVLDSLME